MSMQKSDELGDVAAVLFQQMNHLVTNLWTCGFVLCEKNRDEDEWWLSMDGDFTRGFFLPNVGDYAHATEARVQATLVGEAFDGLWLRETLAWLDKWLGYIDELRANGGGSTFAESTQTRDEATPAAASGNTTRKRSTSTRAAVRRRRWQRVECRP